MKRRLTVATRNEHQTTVDDCIAIHWGPRGWAHITSTGRVTLGFAPESGPPRRWVCDSVSEALQAIKAMCA